MSNYVYVGLWDDFGLRPVFQKVLTVPFRTSTIITTLLAILVTISANRSWKIWRFMLHTLLEKIAGRFPEQYRSAVRQQQTILRNCETTGGALISFWEVATTNRTVSKPASNRVATALILFTILHWGLFIALGILTSQINLGNTVRSLATDDCGVWNATAPTDLDSTLGLQFLTTSELDINRTVAAENYVRNCYTAASATISDCNVFVRHMFPHTTQLVPCPLRDSTLCSAPGSKALAVDSGNISLSDLGVNWPYAKGIHIRKRSVYTPIHTEPFRYGEEEINNYVNQYVAVNSSIAGPEHVQAFAFLVDRFGRNLPMLFQPRNSGKEYDVYVQMAQSGSFAIKSLEPQELAPEFTIVAIRGARVAFPAPSDDPLFYAQVNYTTEFEGRTTVSYGMGGPLNAMVCQDMVEVCSDLTNYCSGWIGPSDLARDVQLWIGLLGPLIDIDTTSHALSIASVPLMQATTYWSLLNRGASVLLATQKLINGIQFMASSEQWKVEAENMFRISLASLQMAPHRMVATPELDRSRVNKVDIFSTAWACSAVKFRSSKHVTLSFFGILTIVVVCGLLTVVSYLDEILGFLVANRTSSLLQPWTRDGYLQLLEDNEGFNSKMFNLKMSKNRTNLIA